MMTNVSSDFNDKSRMKLSDIACRASRLASCKLNCTRKGIARHFLSRNERKRKNIIKPA